MAEVVAGAKGGLVARVESRLATITEWLAQGIDPRRASARARDEWGITRRAGDRYVATVLQRLIADDYDESLESKRARIVAQLYATVQSAKARRRQWYDQAERRWIDAPDPDHRAVVSALQAIATIEGVTSVPRKPGSWPKS